MTAEQMRRSLELIAVAERLRRHLKDYVLLKRVDPRDTNERICVGTPSQQAGSYSPEYFQIPETARRYVFNLWRKETSLRYNQAVRELNQLGVEHQFELIKFSEATGNPL